MNNISHTSLSNLSQHPVSGAIVVGSGDPDAEMFPARHPGDGTAVGGGAAVVGFYSVPLCLHSVGQSSGSQAPGGDQHVSVTLGRRPHVGWETRSCKSAQARNED